MEAIPKLIYESPTAEVVEVKMDACILQASKPDYLPELW